MQLKRTTYCCILVFVANNLFAQEVNFPKKSDKNHHISLNVLTPFISTLSITYERKKNDDEALVFNAIYFNGDIWAPQAKARMLSVALEYKYYITDAFPKGLFIQPYGRYIYFWSRNPSTTLQPGVTSTSYSFLAAGVLIGQQFALKDRITFQYFGGPYYAIPLNRIEEFKRVQPLNGGFIVFGASIGLLLK